ncbi:conserved hypothetical protein [Pediculus humanus corporis]|uniref:Solute carrier organic anion transporter family member n=1 Tax=Pediculus humanus subsp. corporis TaxID=121224 RepID=E0W4B1_PEDHC|nr:uncharacterized protein Phum_PHUM617040 [Pediculus humanus corporis]EEB20468.1 conserved hypothetical protein [Pediculus humanus corporis]
MTINHVEGNSQTQWINSQDSNSTTKSKSGDYEGKKNSMEMEREDENNGITCKMDETNGDLKRYEKDKNYGKLDLSICRGDAQLPSNLPPSDVSTNENEESDDEDQQNDNESDDDLKCGLGVFSPKWMQVFASKQAFLVTFCITWVLQGMYYTYFVSVITTIEKLFQIQSKTTGIIMSATEIGQIGSSLLLTYYGGQGHRPKWIAWGMILFAVSSFMCALPHFIFGEQLIHANDILYSGLPPNADVSDKTGASPNLCRSLYNDNYPPPMLINDHLNFLKENPNYNIRNSFLMLHSESQANDKANNKYGSNVSADTGFRSNSNSSNINNNNNNNVNRSASKDNTISRNNFDKRYNNVSSSILDLMQNSTFKNNYTGYFTLKQEASNVFDCEEDFLQEQRAQSKITQIVLSIFFISLLGVGMGQTAVYTLGIPYIDDNVATRESPLYFAITIGVRILGPAMGFILGSVCTRLYADLSVDPQITPNDPRWVGAWWLGLVLVATLLALSSLAMFSFPKRLKSFKGKITPRAFVRNDKNPSLKDFPKAVKRLLKNDILMFRTASSVLHILPIAGLYTFLPKYLESQFRLAAHAANMISGVGGILVMGIGIIISGVFILRYKPNARFVAAWIAFTAVIYAIGMGILMLIGCPMDDFAGLDFQGAGQPDFHPVCNTTCNCDREKFSPICGIDGKTYFSACHAGCRNATLVDGMVVEVSTASIGYCNLDCSNFVPYILLFSMFVFIHSTSEVGSMLLILRCVDPRDKAMALGLIQFAIGLFGNVPCPIVYGAVVDYACLIWDKACGTQGACWLYDTNVFRTFYHGTTGAILLCAFFVDIVVWYKAGSINFVDDQLPEQSEELSPMKQRSETSV